MMRDDVSLYFRLLLGPRLLPLVLLGCLTLAGCHKAPENVQAAPEITGNWPQFLGPERNGVSPETGLASTWDAPGPKRIWQKDVGAGFSGPVVVDKRLILFHRIGDKEVVDCLDSATGAQNWRFEAATHYHDDFGFDPGPRATPVIAGERVYTFGAEGALHCLDLNTGKEIWGRSLSAEYGAPKGFFGVATSPLLEGGLLWVNVGAPKAGIVALAADTGKDRWKLSGDAASCSSPVAATINGERHVLFFTREGLVDVDPKDGKVRSSKRWRARMNASVNAASPVVVGDDIFLSASYGAGALLLHVDKNQADEVWKGDNILSNHYATSIYHADHLYGFDGRQEQGARLRCIEFRTGKICWTRDGFGCGSMIYADGKLIILNERGELVLVEATLDAYRELARARVSPRVCRAPIALAGGRLYARDTAALFCVDLRK